MKLSVITPSNNSLYLDDLYRSLLEQTYREWEWVLLLNGPLANDSTMRERFTDERVKIFTMPLDVGRVGALKLMASKYATGEVLCEVDHDDILTTDCLFEVNKTFLEHPDVQFVYSNSVHVDRSMNPAEQYSGYYGWTYRSFSYKGRSLVEYVSPPPTPHHVSRIWYAPNHIRCWKTDFYWQIGGHDQSMKIVDDHDLLCRTYLHGKMFHIDKPLYIYRIHGNNTWLQNAEDIQKKQWQNYGKYIYPMMEKWSDENGLFKIDLCGGIDKPKGYESIDLRNGDILGNLDEDWPLSDNSVGILRAHDAIEHLKDPIHTMNEAWRVLAHGGTFMIFVPSSDGRGAFQDPTHVSFWNENSFWYYTRAEKQRFLGDKAKCRFQIMNLYTDFPNEFYRDHKIPCVFAHLIALKDQDKRFYGPLDI